MDFCFESTIYSHLERVFTAYADELALQSAAEECTYAELHERVCRLEAQLARLNLPAASVVALSIPRSSDMIALMLAILKSGHAYLPLDEEYPLARLEYMVSDAKAAAIIASEKMKPLLSSGAQLILTIDELLALDGPSSKVVAPKKNDLAYLIYTSGTTGNPKGVAIEHAQVMELLKWYSSRPVVANYQHCLQFFPISFDPSVLEIFTALAGGKTLHLIDSIARKDPSELLKTIIDQQIERVYLPPSMLTNLALEAIEEDRFPVHLKEVGCGGEALIINETLRHFFRKIPDVRFYNLYGPTETAVNATSYEFSADIENWPELPPLGEAVSGLTIHIVDQELREVEAGVEGEILLSGPMLARGYWRRPELTAQKFIRLKVSGEEVRAYRTGDLGLMNERAELVFKGRLDEQVKVNGVRVELGELEAKILALSGVREVAVKLVELNYGKGLAAYYVGAASEGELREELVKILPQQMIPAAFMKCDSLPLSPSGKVDKKALPQIVTLQKEVPDFKNRLQELYAQFLGHSQFTEQQTFFEAGGTSLQAIALVKKLRKEFKQVLPLAIFFEKSSLESLSQLLEVGPGGGALKSISRTQKSERQVAIIGMSCRFPGANNLEEFWQLLAQGKEGIEFFKEEDLDGMISEEEIQDPSYVKARGILKQVEFFDAKYFGLNPRVAELMDPQMRLMLEESALALEAAGIVREREARKIGIYYGMANNTYYRNHISHHPERAQTLGDWTVSTLNEKDYIATHVAHKLNLRGPAVAVHSACSTSLVAIIEAYRSIERGDCEIALAGGVNIQTPRKSGHPYQAGGIRSSDGHCRPFDAAASGTIFSDGMGVIVLKEMEAAVRDGDQIYAVVKGAGLNNDGGQKMSFTAPSLEGQRDVISMALAESGVDPSSIEMIECHGTATPIGDPIETTALTLAYQDFGLEEKAPRPIFLGSLKGNIGHTVTAAGVAGVIKSVLAMKHQLIPGTLHFKELNPEIHFAGLPFKVSANAQAWKRAGEARRAAISSFGVGGTNAHLILEEYEAPSEVAAPSEDTIRSELFLLSAKSIYSLRKMALSLAKWAGAQEKLDLAKLARTLIKRKSTYSYRAFVVAATAPELISKLIELAGRSDFKALGKDPKVVLALPGQGAQFATMGSNLSENCTLFKKYFDELIAKTKEGEHADLAQVIKGTKLELADTFYAQPALYIFELALLKTLLALKIKPVAFIGHSVGEFAIAAATGVLHEDDALRAICERARLMREVEEGSMLSVRTQATRLSELLDELGLQGQLQIAAYNAAGIQVVAGPCALIKNLQKELEVRKVAAKELATSHAFHTQMMAPVSKKLTTYLQGTPFASANAPIYSTLLGRKLDMAMDARYFAEHALKSVRFHGAMKSLLSDFGPELLLVDCGPRQVVGALALQNAREEGQKIDVISLQGETSEWEQFLKGIALLWQKGVSVDLDKLLETESKDFYAFALYEFEREKYWLENPLNLKKYMASIARGKSVNTMSLITTEIKNILADSSGVATAEMEGEQNFIELGFDSLLLTQVAIEIEKTFGVKLTFRQLLSDYPTIKSLATYLEANLSASARAKFTVSAPPVEESVQNVKSEEAPAVLSRPIPAEREQAPVRTMPLARSQGSISGGGTLETIVLKQLELMNAQMSLLGGLAPAVQSAAEPEVPAVAVKVDTVLKEDAPEPSVKSAQKEEHEGALTKATINTAGSAFGAQARVNTLKNNESNNREAVESIIERYTSMTAKSKVFTQKYRAINADPRVVTGFRPELKEMVYPVVVNRSKDQRLWDIDGNEYIDMTCGFGSNFFGNQNPRINKALHDQLDRGMEIGPQHELVGECAELICEFSGLERAAFCNTGSEAVLGALRMARTITGRKKIVMFTGSYHGINDEVIVRGLAGGKAMPAAAGINRSSVNDILVLEYGSEESYQIIKDQIDDIAAVICEAVQSRRANFRPKEFLLKLRDLTKAHGTALIFDEVITGFRIAKGGAQEYYGIKADIATYGKIVGGGMPIGVIAGTKNFMDALDGGFWNYGDDSAPTAPLTYFAGTFVRHPLALRAMREALLILKEGGQELYDNLNRSADEFVRELNLFCQVMGAPIEVDNFGGVLKPRSTDNGTYNDLFYTLMRLNGVHVYDGFPWFVTLAHTKSDLQQVVSIFKKCVIEMQEIGLFARSENLKGEEEAEFLIPPIPEAKLGRDEMGMPAWYVPDAQDPGQFKKFSV